MKLFIQILMVVFMIQIFSSASANVTDKGYIEAEGVVYPEEGKSLNQLRRIAIMDAYRYLAEQVDTLYVSSKSTVKNLCELDDEINSKVDAALRGAKIVSAAPQSDGSFHATVRMSLYGSNQSLAAAVLKDDIVTEDFLKPMLTNVRSEIQYTGLVIDCRGLNLAPALTPEIKSAGGLVIYAYKNVGYQTTIEKGMSDYSAAIEDSARAGSSPLIVKAVKVSDSCDVIVSDEDADKILAVNQSANILANCAVVLVR